MRVPAKPEEIVEVYLDESSQTKHRYLVLGAIIVEYVRSAELATLIMQARLPDLPAKEAKWVKVSRTKLPAYKRIVDVFFDNPELVHFHSLFVDTSQQDHRKFNAGDAETGFNKEVYQLGMKIAMRLYGKHIFHLYPDYRNCVQTPEELRLILNRGCQSKNDKRDWPFRRAQFRDSAATLQLQLADILNGAIAYHLNGHHKAANASPAKTELARYVMERAKIADVSKGTAITGKFTVWPRRLR
jgi:hypothetical protein